MDAQGVLRGVIAMHGPQRDGGDMSVSGLALLLETAILTENREMAMRLAAPFRPLAAHLLVQVECLIVVARVLGAAAALLGDRTAARAYYEQALDAAGRIGFRPEVALTHLQLVEVLLDGDAAKHVEALSHLDVTSPSPSSGR